MSIISLNNINKSFTLSKPGNGIIGAFFRNKSLINAVKDLSFEISVGERVAFIGPNGAGKSTTIKMLSGILVPSSGSITVAGYNPWQQREKLSYSVGLVFGNRSQLWSHLPVKDSFELLGKIYSREDKQHYLRTAELCELLEVARLLDSPVNRLSLGERMRCELVAALLHKPSILFLDEPTIGLDVSARGLLREYVRRISQNERVTILLTSHDTADIEQVCERVLVINHGQLILDRPMPELRRGYINRKRLKITGASGFEIAPRSGVTASRIDEVSLQVDIDTVICSVDEVIRSIFAEVTVLDLVVEDPPLDETILQIYRNAQVTQ